MIRLISSYVALILFPSINFICDWKYPINNDCYNELWDILKHEFLMLWGILLGLATLFPKGTDLQDKLSWVALNGLIIGMIIPCMIDTYGKDRQIHWFDFVFAGLALYSATYKPLPKWHEFLTVSFINLITFRLVDGCKVYSYVCRVLK